MTQTSSLATWLIADRVCLILRRYMKMSQSQFDSLDENTRQSFLEKQLWIRENYEVGYFKRLSAFFSENTSIIPYSHLFFLRLFPFF